MSRALPAGHPGSGRDVQAVRRQVRRHGREHEADGGRNAARAGGHPQRTAPRRAGNAAGGRREHRADAQGDRRPDRGAGRTEPDRRPSRPRPGRGERQPRQRRQREEEPMLAAAGGRGETPSRSTPPPRMRDTGSASNLPPPDLGMPASRRTEAPPVSPASSDQGSDGWLSGPAEPRRHRRPRTASPARPPARSRSRRRQSAGVAVARHRPADGPQSRRRNVGSLSARREQGLHQAALHAGRPEGVRRSRPQISRRPQLQADGRPLHHRVRAAARRGRARRPRSAGAAQPPHLGNRPGLHPARPRGGTARAKARANRASQSMRTARSVRCIL